MEGTLHPARTRASVTKMACARLSERRLEHRDEGGDRLAARRRRDPLHAEASRQFAQRRKQRPLAVPVQWGFVVVPVGFRLRRDHRTGRVVGV